MAATRSLLASLDASDNAAAASLFPPQPAASTAGTAHHPPEQLALASLALPVDQQVAQGNLQASTFQASAGILRECCCQAPPYTLQPHRQALPPAMCMEGG